MHDAGRQNNDPMIIMYDTLEDPYVLQNHLCLPRLRCDISEGNLLA